MLGDGQEAVEVCPVRESCEYGRHKVFFAECGPCRGGQAEGLEGWERAVREDCAAEFGWEELHC